MEHIAHHGIKGQKWYVRRYQNPDGSLTELGRKRYRKALLNLSKEHDETSKTTQFEKTGIIPKGTEAYRTTYSLNENPLKNRKYVSFSTDGAIEYTNPDLLADANTIWENGHGFVYKAKKDLKVATTKDVEDYLVSNSKNAELARRHIDDMRSVELPDNRVLYKEPSRNIEKLAIKWMRDADLWYGKKLASGNLFSTKYDEDNPVFKHFAELGYDAISDIEDGGIGGTLGAAILLNPSKSFTAKEYKDKDEYYDYLVEQDLKQRH